MTVSTLRPAKRLRVGKLTGTAKVAAVRQAGRVAVRQVVTAVGGAGAVGVQTMSRLKVQQLMGGASVAAIVLSAPGAYAQVESGSSRTIVNSAGGNNTVTTTNVNAASKTAFNRFTKFNVQQSTTTTLVLPTNMQNLVNVVAGNVQIDGAVVSKLQTANGVTGGNLFFITSGGFVVGATGSLNTGRLIVRGTNSAGDLLSTEGFADATGVPGAAFNPGSLLDYNAVSAITVNGAINAPGGIDLKGTTVSIGALGRLKTGAAGIAALSGQPETTLVNIEGLQHGTQLVKVNGGIAIVGTDSVAVAGGASLDARFGETSMGGAMRTQFAGGIDVASAGAITLGGTLNAGTGATAAAVTITASKEQEGSGASLGSFTSPAAVTAITLASGGTITGGAVTLAAKATDSVGRGLAEANATIDLAGTIQSRSLTVTADADATSTLPATAADVFGTAGLVRAALGDVPFLNEGLTTIGDPTAPLSLIGYQGAESRATVTVRGTAQLTATGTDGVVLRSVATQSNGDGDVPGQRPALVVAKIDGAATAEVLSGARITSGGKLLVGARNQASGTLETEIKSEGSTALIAVAALKADVAATARIDTGAVVSVADALSVVARTDSDFSVAASGEADGDAALGIVGALLLGSVTTNAVLGTDIGTGSTLPTSVTVEASSVSTNSVSEASTSQSADTGEGETGGGDEEESGGLTSAGGLTSVNQGGLFDNFLGGFLSSAGDDAGSGGGAGARLGSAIAVNDLAATTKAAIAPTSGTAAPTVRARDTVAVVASRVDGGIKTAAVSEAESEAGATSISAALALGRRANETVALIAPNAIVTAGRIAVQANLRIPRPYGWAALADAPDLFGSDMFADGVQSGLNDIFDTITDITSPASYLTGYAKSASKTDGVGANGAINYFGRDDSTSAWIGSGATVTATVTATTPWSITASGGDAKLLLTAVEAAELVSAGIDTLAAPVAGMLPVFTFDKGLTVEANARAETVFLSGNKGEGSGDEAKAVGGVLSISDTTNSTIAGVGASARLNAAGGLLIAANGAHNSYLLLPGGGEGGSIAATGIVGLALLDETTRASLANSAIVSSPSVAVRADQDLNLWSGAGALTTGADKGIGVAVAVSKVDTDTRAIVGDNADDAAAVRGVDARVGTATGGANGTITTNALSVNASTYGQAGALSVALAKSESDESSGESGGGGGGSGESGGEGSGGGGTLASLIGGAGSRLALLSSTVAKAEEALDPVLEALTGQIDKATSEVESVGGGTDTGSGGGSTGEAKKGFQLGVAGAASVGLYAANTISGISNVTVTPLSTATGAASAIDVLATRNASFFTLAGGAAKVGSDDGSSAGVAGALALTDDSGNTQAYLAGVTATKAGQTSVQALTNGSIVGIGLGASQASGDEGKALAVSATLSFLHGATNATVANSTLTGVGGADLRVRGYNATDVGLGAGALSKGGKAGLGATLTLSRVSGSDAVNTLTGKTFDFVGAHLVGTAATFSRIGVVAQAPVRLMSGAASAGMASAPNGIAVAMGGIWSDLSRSIAATVTGGTLVATAVDGIAAACADEAECGVAVLAGGARLASLDAVLGSAAAGSGGFDFGAADVADAFGIRPNGATILSIAGVIQVGKTAAGLSFAGAKIDDSYTAKVSGSTVTAASSDAAVIARDDAYIGTLSVGAAVSRGNGGFAFMGSGTVNLVNTSTSATIEGGNGAVVTARAVTVDVRADAGIDSLAGNIAGGKGTAIGLAGGFNEISRRVSAGVSGLTINATGPIRVGANAQGRIRTASVAGALATGGGAAIGGSFSVNTIGDTVAATLGKGTTLSNTTNYATIAATNNARVEVLAGGVAGSSSGAAVGVAVAVNRLGGSTAAAVNGATVRSADLDVLASSGGSISVISVGAAAGQSAGIGGSIVTNLTSNETSATIGKADTTVSTVTAGNSVSVQAANATGVYVAGGALGIGSSAGVGVSVTTNVLGTSTTASIADATIAAAGGGAGREVADGRLLKPGTQTALDLSSLVAFDLGGSDAGDTYEAIFMAQPANASDPATTMTALGGGTKTVRGLSVNAATRQNVGVLSASLAGSSSAAVAVNVGTTVLSGTTTANIVRSTVGGTAGAQGDVDVLASGNAVVGSIIAGAAGSGSVAGAGAVAATKFSQDVTAEIAASTVTAAGRQLAVNALSNQQVFGLTAGIAVSGSLAFAGSGLVNIFESDTLARVIGGSVAAGGLTVNADTSNSIGGATGAIGVGIGAVGAAGAFNVTTIRDRTSATIGASGNATATALTLTGDLAVKVAGTNKFSGLAVSGAGGFNAGISGLANVLTINSAATAGVYGAIVTARDIDVKSLTAVQTRQLGGAIGVAGLGAGIGVAMNFTLIKDGSFAEVVGSTITAASLDVLADKTRDVTATTASAGAGLVGFGGSISIAIIGSLGSDGLKSDESGDLGSNGSFTGMLGRGDQLAATDLSANNKSLTAAEKAKASTVQGSGATVAYASAADAATAARVTGSTVTATGTVNIKGTDATTSKATVGSVAIGAVGVGGAVAFTRLRGSVDASTDAATTITAGSLSIEALARDGSGDAAKLTAFAGAAGLVGLGAAVADIDSKVVVTAKAAGTLVGRQGTNDALSVKAADTTNLFAEGLGAAAGAGAIGLAAGVIVRGSSVTAEIADSATVRNFNGIDVEATDSGTVDAQSIAAAGGIVSGAGSLALALGKSTVIARIGTGADTRYGANGLDLKATNSAGLSADAKGFAVGGGVGVGVSVATAIAKGTVSAIDNGATHGSASGALRIEAALTAANGIKATAASAAGGVLAGAQGSAAVAKNEATVMAQLNNNAATLVSSASVKAINTNVVTADARGISGGILALGGVGAGAENKSTTKAEIGGVSGDNLFASTGAVTVSATSNDTLTSFAKAGSGGVVAGSAAAATVKDDATTSVTIGARNLSASDLTVEAKHTANYAGAADAKSAAAAGASAAIVRNDLTGTTTATIAPAAYLLAGTMRLLASNSFFNATRPGGAEHSAVGGAGGLANVGAVSIDTLITGAARVLVGAGAQLYVVGNPITILQNLDSSDKGLYIDATTLVRSNDTGILEMAGAFQGPYAEARNKGIYTNAVDVGANAILHSNGRLGIGAYGTVQQNSSADVKVSGLAAAGGGKSNADVLSTQTVTIGNNADLLSYGNMQVGAGRNSRTSDINQIAANATTNVFNNTAIPITAILEADAKSISDNVLTLGTGSKLRSVLDVTLTAAKGDVSAKGSYVGKNPYLTIFASDKTGGGSSATGTGDLRLGGEVVAGVSNQQTIRVEGSNVIVTNPLSVIDNSPTRFIPTATFVGTGQANTFTPLDDINARRAQLSAERALATTTQDRKNVIDGELELLTALYSDLQGQAANGLATVQTSPIYAAGGDIRVAADTITKTDNTNPALRAQGDATVTITNPTTAALLVGEIYVPTSGTGQLIYEGVAKAIPTGIAVNEGSGATPRINIENTLNSNAPGATGAVSSVFINGPIYAPTATVSVNNQSGSIAQFGSILASQLTLTAPYGSYFVNQTGIFNIPEPSLQWQRLGIAGTSNDGSNGFSIAQYAANWLFNRNGSLNAQQLTIAMMGSDSLKTSLTLIGGDLGNIHHGDNDSSYTYGYGGNHPYRFANDNTFLNYYGPFGSDDWWVRLTVINPVALKIVQGAASQSPTSSGVTVGKSVVINADVININAPITAGRDNNASLLIDARVQQYINEYKAWKDFGVLPETLRGSGGGGFPFGGGGDNEDLFRQRPELYFPIVNGMLSLARVPDFNAEIDLWDVSRDLERGRDPVEFGEFARLGNIGAAFDVRTTVDGGANSNAGKIVLSNIDASGGGRISLNGKIINTDQRGAGKLIVRSGLGQININNTTALDLVVGSVNTGTGGQDGIIQITDRNFTNNAGGFLTNWWRNRQGTDVVESFTNRFLGGTTIESATFLGSSNDRLAAYNPLGGQRYVWFDDYSARRTISIPNRSDHKTVTASAWTVTSTSNNLPYRRGTAYISTTEAANAAYQTEVVSASLSYAEFSWGYQNVVWQAGDGKITRVYYHAADNAYVTTKSSIKADNQIGLQFVGNNNGFLNINSGGSIFFDGNLQNGLGNTNITTSNGAIVNRGGGTLSSAGSMLAAKGAIGSIDNPLFMSNDRFDVAGNLTAVSTDGSIVIDNLAGAIRANRVQASAGNVSLSSTGGILGTGRGDGADVTGRTVSLNSSEGGIGAALPGVGEAAVAVNANIVNVAAKGDILLRANSGDLNINAIRSTAGKIELTAANGTVVAKLPTVAEAAPVRANEAALYASLNLTNPNAGASAVAQFEAGVNVAYKRYWQIRNALAAGSTTDLTPAARALFRAQAAAILQGDGPDAVDPASLTDFQIDDAITGELANARATLTNAFGTDATYATALTQEASTFSYALGASDPRRASITHGSSWSSSQLGTTIGGRQSGLTATNIHAQTGITITNNGTVTPPNITINVKVAGGVTTFTVMPTGGTAYVASDTTVPDGGYSLTQVKELLANQGGFATLTKLSDTEYNFALAPTPFVSTRTDEGMIDVKSNRDFRLEIDGDINLNMITTSVTGTLFLKSRTGNIMAGSLITGLGVGGLSLTAAGYAGTLDAPLVFQAVNPIVPVKLIDVTTGLGFALRFTGGVAIGDLTFNGAGSIVAGGDISNYHGAIPTAKIAGAGVLTLRTDGDPTNTQAAIGTNSRPFSLVTAPGTAVSLFTSNAVLDAPTLSEESGPGNLTLASGTIARGLIATATGNIGWHAVDTGAIAASTVALTAQGSIGAAGNAVRIDAPTVALKATGTDGDIDANLVNTTGTAVRVSALQAAAGAIRVTASALNMGAVSGNDGVSITTAGNLSGSTVTSQAGDVNLVGGGTVSLSSIIGVNGLVTARSAGLLSLGSVTAEDLALQGDVVTLTGTISAADSARVDGRQINTGPSTSFTDTADLTLAATGALALNAATGFSGIGALTLSAGDAAAGGTALALNGVDADTITVNTPVGFTFGMLNAGISANLSARDGIATITGVSRAPSLTIAAQTISTNTLLGVSATLTAAANGSVALNGPVTLQRDETGEASALTVTAGTVALANRIAAQDAVTITAQAITGTRRASFLNAETLRLTATGALLLDPATSFTNIGNATLQSGTLAAGGSAVTIGGFMGRNLTIVAPVGIALSDTTIGDSLSLQTGGTLSLNGTIAAGGAVTASAGTIDFAAGSLGVADSSVLNLTADMIATSVSTGLTSRGNMTINTRGSLQLASLVAGGGTVTVGGGDLTITGPLTTTGTNFRLGASGAVRFNSAITAAGNLSVNAGGDLAFTGTTSLNGPNGQSTLTLTSGGTTVLGAGASITAAATGANVRLTAGSIAMDPLASITGAAVSLRAIGDAVFGDVLANAGAGQSVSLRAGGTLSVGLITGGTTLVAAANGMAVLRRQVDVADLTVTARDDIFTSGLTATAATFNSGSGSITLGNATRVNGLSTGSPTATLDVTAARTLMLAGPTSAAGGMKLNAQSIVSSAGGYITDADGPGALTTLRADVINVAFNTGNLTGPALRIDARGLTGANVNDATFRFATLRPIQFDALWVDRAAIAATTELTYLDRQVRDELIVTDDAGTPSTITPPVAPPVTPPPTTTPTPPPETPAPQPGRVTPVRVRPR